tara:strand:+ start:159 stop:302 length:144 start_codon:yes stop_codon:yes gene_type:complete
MSKNLTANNIETDGPHDKDKESDYKILMTRLKEIKRAIVLLEKTIFR